MEKTIFYIFGSFFFAAATIAILVLLFYCRKILKIILKTSSEIEEKVENFSSCISVFANIFEKLISIFKHYDRRKRNKKEELG